MLLERLFFMAAFMLLFRNLRKLLEIDGNQVFINLLVVHEQVLMLLVLIYFIHRMPETAYRIKVLRWLKVFLFLFAGGAIARFRDLKQEKIVA